MNTETLAGASGPSPTQEFDEGTAFFHGRMMPLADAQVSIATHALQYGTGCFEGIRAYWNEEQQNLYLLKAPEHYQRFHDSCRMIRILCPYAVEDLLEITRALLRTGGFRQDVYIRPVAFKASRVIKLTLKDLRDDVAIYAVPMGNYIDVGGLHAIVSAWTRVSDNAIPARSKLTGSYVNMALASDDAHEKGYDEAILLGADGHVSEGAGSNLFMVRRGTLITPPVTADILEGITRSIVMELAEENGIPVAERPIDRTELYVADEVFLTGTGAQIAPITAIDGRMVGSGRRGPMVGRLQDAFFRAVRGDDPNHRDWVLPVYD
ncbi:MAG: branched-chain amino acid transaminase [Thermaerobacter sp.]|nr:branched-chain amino acid transaminase [Thermaerobacter sp.]